MSESTTLAGTALMKTPSAAAATTAPLGSARNAPLGPLSYATPLAVLQGTLPPKGFHTVAPRPVHYALKRQAVQAAWAMRAMETSAATFRLFATGRAFDAPLDLLQMQHAVVKQMQQLGESWVNGLAAWLQECSELKAANTMSKISEQEFNLIGQFSELVSDQTTAFVNLMESVQVGYGYWVNEKLEA